VITLFLQTGAAARIKGVLAGDRTIPDTVRVRGRCFFRAGCRVFGAFVEYLSRGGFLTGLQNGSAIHTKLSPLGSNARTRYTLLPAWYPEVPGKGGSGQRGRECFSSTH
jgi:hypothetical protein